jgi:hypothetical protein
MPIPLTLTTDNGQKKSVPSGGDPQRTPPKTPIACNFVGPVMLRLLRHNFTAVVLCLGIEVRRPAG